MTFDERLAEAAGKGWIMSDPYKPFIGTRLKSHSTNTTSKLLCVYDDCTFSVHIAESVDAKVVVVEGSATNPIPTARDVCRISAEEIEAARRTIEGRLAALIRREPPCVTANHLVHTDNRGWVPAGDLTPEDQVTRLEPSREER